MKNIEIQDKLGAIDRARNDFEIAFDRCQELTYEWDQLQAAEIASGQSSKSAWWTVYQTPRGRELYNLDRVAQFDRVRAGFQYDAVMMAAKAIIAIREEE